MSDKTATFAVNLEGDASSKSKEYSSELEKLRQKTQGLIESTRAQSAALRSLRGATTEVQEAKERLRASISSERDALSAANLALLKQGTTYEKLASQTRALEKEKEKLDKEMRAKALDEAKTKSDKLKASISAAGGPVDALRSKFENLSTIAGGGAAGALAVVAVGATALAAGFVFLGVKLGEAIVSFGEFVIRGADAARSAGLLREAATGSAKNAAALGTQIDSLAGKVPTARDKLNELATEMARGFNHTRVSGQGFVDTLNAVAQAAAAMGPKAGSAIQNIIDRSKQFGRVHIDYNELLGSGLQLQDVAGALAKRLKIGLAQAQGALLQGTVGVNDAAGALRDAVETKFGKINAKQVLGFGAQIEKFQESLAKMAGGINIDPLLEQLNRFFSLFDEKTVTGKAVKQLVDLVGTDLVKAMTDAMPRVSEFFESTVTGALNAAIALERAKKGYDDFAAKHPTVTSLGWEGIGDALQVVLLGPLVGLPSLLGGLVVRAGIAALDATKAWGPSALEASANFIEGLVQGIESGAGAVVKKVEDLADSVKSAFKDALGIHSPSVVFKKYGEAISEGASRGVDAGAGGVQGSVEDMAPTPPRVAAAAAAGGAGGATPLVVNVYVAAGASAETVRQARASFETDDFATKMLRQLEAAAQTAGVPTQAPAAV